MKPKSSSYLASKIDVYAGKTAPLEAVSNRAFKTSGLTLDQWNALPEHEREVKLSTAVDEMRAINMTARAEGRGTAETRGDEVGGEPDAPQV